MSFFCSSIGGVFLDGDFGEEGFESMTVLME